MEQAHRSAFSLVELLVVISILTILTTIRIPVAIQSRENSRKTTCQSNLRQLSMATQQYLQDYDRCYPSVLHWEAHTSTSPPLKFSQLIYPYVRAEKVFRCPSVSPDAPSSRDHPEFDAMDYMWNRPVLVDDEVIRDHKGAEIAGLWLGKSEDKLSHLATVYLMCDSGWVDPATGAVRGARQSAPTTCGRTDFGSTLHSGGGNYSFLDGHVKWLTPERFAENNCTNPPLRSSGN